MALKITGRVIEILEEQSGEGRNGPWRKQDFVIETESDYPAQVCITQWGDNIEKFAVTEGETLDVHIDLRSREYNGRWYTDVKAWKVERQAEPAPSPSTGGGDQPPHPADDISDADLPF
ncbi:MAG: DUF3127 domain-containing protein [Gemmatimonadetes bacterium]|nr:DUF3127 domain-containing protein [Gemmatimonadota bacterium]